MFKDFDKWNKIKKRLDQNKEIPTFNEREIWWCSFGVNVGYEVMGKGSKFWRPVLILDKHNKHTFLGLSISTRLKSDNPYFYKFTLKGKERSVILSQARTLSSKRLTNKIGTIPEPIFREILKAFKNSL